jgi:hypothetical protein
LAKLRVLAREIFYVAPDAPHLAQIGILANIRLVGGGNAVFIKAFVSFLRYIPAFTAA